MKVRLIEDVLPGIGLDTDGRGIKMVVDRMRVATDEDSQTRIRDSVARAFSYGGRRLRDGHGRRACGNSRRASRPTASSSNTLTEHLFSFNNPLGACPRREGVRQGDRHRRGPRHPRQEQTIYEDAMARWRGETMRNWKQQLIDNAAKFDFPIHTPFHELTPDQKRLLWRGNQYFHGLDEFFQYIDSGTAEDPVPGDEGPLHGQDRLPRLRRFAPAQRGLYVQVGGSTIADLVTMPVDELIRLLRRAAARRPRCKTRRRASSPRSATACNTSLTWGSAT